MKERKNLSRENKNLKMRLAEAKELLAAIKSGAVDALVTNDQKVFILKGADYAYRVFVENMNEGAATLTRNGIVMYCNNSLAKTLGVSIESIIGGPFFDFVAPNDIPKLKSILRRSKDQISRSEIQLKKDYKMLFPVAVSCSPLKLEDEGICMVITDLTKEKLAQTTFERANAYHRSLIEVSVDSLVTIDAHGKIADVNKATELVTGYNREKLIGTDFADYFTEPEKARVGYKKVFREGTVQDYELEIKHKDGHLTQVLYNAAVYKDETGKVAGIFASAKDITKRKLAEDAARQASAYNRNLIEVSLDPLVTISPEGKIIDVNEATIRATGLTRQKLIGTDFSDYFTEPKKARQGYQEVFKKGFVSDYPLTLKQKSGKTMDVLYNATVYKDIKGNVIGVFAAARDVTELKNAELEITKQREELLHVTRVGKLSEFTASLAHEISQPLTAILSYAQTLQRLFKGREPQLQEILQYIINDDKRAAAVIQQLRAMLKKTASEMKPLDINVLVNETVALITTNATIRKDVLKIELESNLPLVRGDQVQLQQVLLNLTSNSFDAIKHSRGVHSVLIRTSRKDTDTIIVEVKDSGCGVSKKDIPRLFSHFFTSKPDGLGMGLSISRSIVKAHGGRIGLKNNSDRGATFYFTIPVISKSSAEIK